MDFDIAKENIQPLAVGRNASILQASLRVESPQELQAERRQFEDAIRNYKGDDPLEPWYTYISWIEQSCPSGGKESGLDEVLTKCLIRFENMQCYFQDRRMVKLYIKFIDNHDKSIECYQQLYAAGIGTMVADLYISWAYCYDLMGNARKADEVFRRGIACRAQPFEELQEAHQHFGFSVAQRLIYHDNDVAKETANMQLHERRKALSSLRGYKHSRVAGSIRTGDAIKGLTPGTIKIESSKKPIQNNENKIVNVRADDIVPAALHGVGTVEAFEPAAHAEQQSVVQKIIAAVRDQENSKEPGLWNKVTHKKKSGNVFKKTDLKPDLGFNIHEDNSAPMIGGSDKTEINAGLPYNQPILSADLNINKPFKYPINFQSKNRPLPEWHTPVTIENTPEESTFPTYNKCMLYPRPNMEFQPEELRAYNILKRNNISNTFTQQRDTVWSSRDINANVRQYPNFAKRSRPQKRDALDDFFVPPQKANLMVPFDKLYNVNLKEEFQNEELMVHSLKLNETIAEATDMDMTLCESSSAIQRRKSFFPSRKSFEVLERTKISFLPSLASSIENIEMHINEEEPKEDRTMGIHNEEKMYEEQKSMNAFAELAKIKVTVKSNEMESPKEKCSATIMVSDQCNHSKAAVEALTTTTPTDKNLKAVEDCKTKTSWYTSHEGTKAVLSDEIQNEEYIYEKQKSMEANKELANLKLDVMETPKEKCTQNIVHNQRNHSKMTVEALTTISTDKSLQAIGESFERNLKVAQGLDIDVADENAAVASNDFEFKAPALPTTTSKISKMPFEIYAENSPPKQEEAGMFEETCSTQTFNIFVRSQSMSTPITKQKVNQRQFGTVLRDIPPPVALDVISDQQVISTVICTDPQDAAEKLENAEVNAFYSIPEQKQLSTILETSENGTTHGTTGTSTKSTISSPECEFENNAESKVQVIANLMEDMKLETNQPPLISPELGAQCSELQQQHEILSEQPILPVTPGAIRFSIFEDRTETIGVNQMAGNFTRLEEKEDTSSGLTMRSGRFQEDRTETVSKVLLSSRYDVKYQDDKTETFSKMFLKSPGSTGSKISTLLPCADIATVKTKVEDCYDYFAETPPRAGKSNTKTFEQNKLSNTSDFLGFGCTINTPVSSAAKRFCNINTPKLHLIDKKSDERSSFQAMAPFSAKLNKSKPVPEEGKSLANSFLPADDFSFVPETQEAIGTNANILYAPKEATKRVCDFFTREYSYIPETQPKAMPLSENAIKNELECPTKPSISKLNFEESFLPDFPSDMDSQPNGIDYLIHKKKKNSKDILDLSSVMNSQPDDTYSTNWQKTRTEWRKPDQHMLAESFMEDFSVIKDQPTEPFRGKSPNFLIQSPTKPQSKILTAGGAEEPFYLRPSFAFQSFNQLKRPQNYENQPSADFFELNAETNTFASNMSMIRNSTLLPNADLKNKIEQSESIRKKSLHIKMEPLQLSESNPMETSYLHSKSQQVPLNLSQDKKLSFAVELASNNSAAPVINLSDDHLTDLETNDKFGKPSIPTDVDLRDLNDDLEAGTNDDDDDEMSIYVKESPKTPILRKHIWVDTNEVLEHNDFVHDLNDSSDITVNNCVDLHVNPFNADLVNAFLYQIDFTNYIEKLPSCMLMHQVPLVRQNLLLKIHKTNFKVLKPIGEGAYGAIHCGLNTTTGNKCALKQERPPNYWEYYICLEVQSRIKVEEMLPAFMSIDYALIGNNASILISAFSPHGSLITICNKIKKHTSKNVDEYLVMCLACELLEIMDHLHAIDIIHADIKADNFLLMNKLSYPVTNRSLQLIDFGVSIDMRRFAVNQTFSYVANDNAFKCIEMRENRPWTYQLDLYGLAGVIHVLLFGKYMDVAQRANGSWMHKSYVPRYFKKALWDTIFETLLNVRDCCFMPNLQQLRALLKAEIAENEKYVLEKIAQFNNTLDA